MSLDVKQERVGRGGLDVMEARFDAPLQIGDLFAKVYEELGRFLSLRLAVLAAVPPSLLLSSTIL